MRRASSALKNRHFVSKKRNIYAQAQKADYLQHKQEHLGDGHLQGAHSQNQSTGDLQERCSGYLQDPSIFIQLLQACIDKKALLEGKRVHADILKCGFVEDRLLGSSVVRMYIKCGSLKDAQLVFERMQDRSMVLWTSMIAAHVSDGNFDKGWDLFRRMQLEGVLPDKVTFVSILNACASSETLSQGKLVHALVIEKGLELDVAVGNALVKMYGKCGSLEDVVRMFDKMSQRDVISWTGMITAYAQHGHCKEAFVYYLRMQLEGVVPNNITFLAVLGACVTLGQGKLVHANIVEAEWEAEVMVGNAIVNMYSKCGSLNHARDMFHRMNHWNVTSWNAMIAACTQHGFCSEALEFFHRMQVEEAMPNKISLVTVLSACVTPEHLAEGRLIHACIARNGFESEVVVGTALVNMYSRCGSLGDARKSFDRIHQKNVVSWNTMVAAYARDDSHHFYDAFQVYRQMLLEGVRPTRTTVVNILNAVEALADGKQIHACIAQSGLYSDLFVGNALVNMYGKCGSLVDASTIFDRIVERDVLSWNAMMSACIEQGQCSEALQLFHEMQLEGVVANKATFLAILNACAGPEAVQDGKRIHGYIAESGFEPDTVIGNSIINMYNKCGSLEDSRAMFERMQERSVVSWTSIIAACTQHGKCKEAIELFGKMEFEPDKVTYITVLEACTVLSAQQEGKLIHAQIAKDRLESDVVVGTALVHMYSKCANMEEAGGVFCKLARPSVASWNAMIGGYAQNGHSKEAREFFHDMQQDGTQPDHITFLGVVSACSHAGLVEEGLRCFASMQVDCGVSPMLENYGCLIDLLARAGRLEEAHEFLSEMPYRPSDITWKTLLGACKVQGDVDRGKSAAHRVLEREPQSSAAYVELYNMYASTS